VDGKIFALGEGGLVHLLNTGGDGDIRQRDTAGKGILIDVFDPLGKGDLLQALAVFETMIFAVGAFILVGPELIAANLITNSLIETVSITKFSLLASTMLILFMQLIMTSEIKDFFKYTT